jgi:hypothetical protein
MPTGSYGSTGLSLSLADSLFPPGRKLHCPAQHPARGSQTGSARWTLSNAKYVRPAHARAKAGDISHAFHAVLKQTIHVHIQAAPERGRARRGARHVPVESLGMGEAHMAPGARIASRGRHSVLWRGVSNAIAAGRKSSRRSHAPPSSGSLVLSYISIL